jgi:CheY-like chemotaxis protein
MHSLLIIEDDELLALMLHRALEQAGYLCTTAMRLEDVAQRARQLGQIDLVLADVFMPGGTSFKEVEILRNLFPEARVVLMSGYGREQALRSGDILGGEWVFLQKPFPTTVLLQVIEHQLAPADTPA